MIEYAIMIEYARGEVFRAEDGTWCEVQGGFGCRGCHFYYEDVQYIPLSGPPELIPMQVDLEALGDKRESKVKRMLEAAERAGVRWHKDKPATNDINPYTKYMGTKHGELWQVVGLDASYRLVTPREWIARMDAQAERNASKGGSSMNRTYVPKPKTNKDTTIEKAESEVKALEALLENAKARLEAARRA